MIPVAVDEAAVSACRHWLQQLQSFIMALQRDVDAFTMEAIRTRRIPPRNILPGTFSERQQPRGGGNRSLHGKDNVMDVPSLTSWEDFLANISSQFDSAVEEMDKIRSQTDNLVRERE